MLKAKLLAMCVCPAVLAPPTILAIHRPARHAVAHLLQRAAHQLDDNVPSTVPQPTTQYANIPCAPTLADTAGGGGAVPTIGGVGLASLIPPTDQAIHNDSAIPLSGIGGGDYFPGAGGSGGGGGGGGSISTPPSVGGSMGSVPEPATWALLVTGFTVVGAGLRYRRVFTV